MLCIILKKKQVEALEKECALSDFKRRHTMYKKFTVRNIKRNNFLKSTEQLLHFFESFVNFPFNPLYSGNVYFCIQCSEDQMKCPKM